MWYKTSPTHLVQYISLNSFQITEGRITSSELKITTEYTSVVYTNTFNTICIKEYNFTCCQVWVYNLVSYARERTRQDLYEKSTEVRQLDMEKRTWGIHILYSSPAITTVLRSWKMRRAGNEACKREMHIQKGTTLNIFDDIK